MTEQPNPYRLQSQRLVNALSHLVPGNAWFRPAETRKVTVQVFRVYRVPFARMPYLPSASLVLDFPLLRAVFGRADEFFYPDPEGVHLFPAEDGRFVYYPNQVLWDGPNPENFRDMDVEELYRSTGDAPVLFLLTPSSTNTELDEMGEGGGIVQGFESDQSATERLIIARAAIVAVMGRNAAFEMLFDFVFEFTADGYSRRTFLAASRLSPTGFDPPKLDGTSAALTERVFERIQAQEPETMNRLKLALRWYLLAQKNPLGKEETNVDVLLRYWIALEALAGPGDPLVSIRQTIIGIHRLEHHSYQYLEDSLFPIGRIAGLRGRVVHQGHTPPIGDGLLKLMDDLFVDMLLHSLDLSGAHKTDAYLDGSAIGLLP